MLLRKIAVLVILSVIPLNAHAAEWYSFLQNKGWYSFEGGSGSAESSGEQEKPLVQPTTSPGASQTQPAANNTSQTGNQPGQSSWFNKQ